MRPEHIFFLPGAAGSPDFWRPAGERLATSAERVYFGWPGYGSVPHDPTVRGLDDIVQRVLQRIEGPTALVAQSMGGIIAVRVALARPGSITHLVLCVTSGGIDMSALGAQDWRAEFLAANPAVPRWFIDDRSDYSAFLPAITAPTLLLWGDADPISPVAAGERLNELLPNSRLVVIPGGMHDLASTHAAEVARLIDAHLEA